MTKRIAFLTASEGIEAVELTDPWDAVTGAGHTAELLSPESGEVQLFNHLDKAETRPVDKTVADASVSIQSTPRSSKHSPSGLPNPSPFTVPRFSGSGLVGSPARTKMSHANRVAAGSPPASRQRMMCP